MKNVLVLTVAVFCMALSAGCAQLPPTRESVSSDAPPQPLENENRADAARLDARWSSAIVGMPVKTSSGASLGRVQEVLVDGYGRPAFAIVRHGGVVAGLGSKYAAIPWPAVAEMLDRDKLVVSEQILQKAPALSGAGIAARNGEWRRDAELYWNGKVASAQ